MAAEGKVYIHPYDDPDVIAGQGTIGLELLRQMPRGMRAVFVPVGGGGLIAGIAAYLKRLRPEIKIIGVEPVDADAMTRSLAAGHRVRLERVGLFADGVAVSQVGALPFELCRQYVDEMVLVNTDEICAAIKDVFEETRSILEPAGALALAGLKAWAARQDVGVDTGNLVAILSGANANFDNLRFVAEQAELGEKREAILAVTIPERPGSFKAFCELIGARAITEFNYRLADPERAHIFVGLQMADRSELEPLLARLRAEGLEAQDLSENEMAKLHVRHLVGGRAPAATHERLYRFEFPERPGALLRFLERMSRGWNISLFHYRNHGADYGRVLAGIQVPPQDQAAFQAFLDGLGYRSWMKGTTRRTGCSWADLLKQFPRRTQEPCEKSTNGRPILASLSSLHASWPWLSCVLRGFLAFLRKKRRTASPPAPPGRSRCGGCGGRGPGDAGRPSAGSGPQPPPSHLRGRWRG